MQKALLRVTSNNINNRTMNIIITGDYKSHHFTVHLIKTIFFILSGNHKFHLNLEQKSRYTSMNCIQKNKSNPSASAIKLKAKHYT